jgi:hypothetical protein
MSQTIEAKHLDERMLGDGIETNFAGIKKCDKEFVGVSRQVRGILVTNDEALIDKICEHRLDKEFKTVMVETAQNEL